MNKVKLYVDDILVYQQEGIVIPPIPQGNHVVRITASSPLGNNFKISIEAE